MATHISSDASQTTILKKSNRGRCRQAILASCMALAFFAGPGMVWAGDSDKHRLINQQRVQDLKERVADARGQLEHHKHNYHTGGGVPGSIQTLESRVAALEAKVASMASFDPAALRQALQSLQSQVDDINNMKIPSLATNAKLAELTTKVDDGVVPDLKRYVSVNANDMNGVRGPHVVFRGVNIHVQSGSNATADTTSGLGNLIIGYNEPNPNEANPTQARLGAHNLVGGSQNGFTSYGGLVLGIANKVTGTYASVVSGNTNTASGVNAAVVGGNGNTAGGDRSVVYGGLNVMTVNQNSYAPVQGARPAGN